MLDVGLSYITEHALMKTQTSQGIVVVKFVESEQNTTVDYMQV